MVSVRVSLMMTIVKGDGEMLTDSDGEGSGRVMVSDDDR